MDLKRVGNVKVKKHYASRAFKEPHDLCITSRFLALSDDNLSHQGFTLKKRNTVIPNTMSCILGKLPSELVALAGTCRQLLGCVEHYLLIYLTTS